MSGLNFEFPDPWYPAGEFGGFEVIPITNGADLYREGRTMHHCVGTYADMVHSGAEYFYSVAKAKNASRHWG